MESRKKVLILALFYPFTIATCMAGFIAFLMLLLKFPILAASTVMLWFYLACAASIYIVSKPAVRLLEMQKPFLLFTFTVCIFAVLSTIFAVWGG